MRILDEKKHAIDMIKQGFIQKKYEFELKILAKYYYSEKFTGQELKNKLLEFCKLHIKNFNEIKYINMLKRSLKYVESNSLFIVEPVKITQKEIDKIKSLDNLKVEKVAFILLVMSKVNRQSYELYLKDKIDYYKKVGKTVGDVHMSTDYIIKDKISSVFTFAKVYLKKVEKNKIFKLLIDKKFIEMSDSCKYKILYVENDSNDMVLELDYFEDFVLEYERLIGENIGYCECKKPIRITSSNNKYCHTCKKEKWKLYNAKKQKEYRIKNRV